MLPAEDIKQLPTNNIDSERVFSVFDQKAAASSRCRNYKFKAKSIWNDMTLHKSTMTISDKKAEQIFKLLNQREDDWNKQQNFLKDKKILEKLKKVNNQSIYTNKLLQTCKSWGGPVTSTEEPEDILRAHEDLAEKIVCTELSYYRDTRKTEVIYNGDLFKWNKISHEDRLVNLGILLGNNSPDQNTTLPTKRDAITIRQGNSSANDDGDDVPEFKLNKIYVTLWLDNKLPTWCLGYCISKNDDNSYRKEHLEWVKKWSNFKWKNPRVPETADIMAENIFKCNTEWDWDVSKERFLTFTMRNHKQIRNLVKDLQKLDLLDRSAR